jgi:hypothetical protein
MNIKNALEATNLEIENLLITSMCEAQIDFFDTFIDEDSTLVPDKIRFEPDLGMSLAVFEGIQLPYDICIRTKVGELEALVISIASPNSETPETALCAFAMCGNQIDTWFRLVNEIDLPPVKLAAALIDQYSKSS